MFIDIYVFVSLSFGRFLFSPMRRRTIRLKKRTAWHKRASIAATAHLYLGLCDPEKNSPRSYV